MELQGAGELAHLIEIAVAPVFLLAAIAGFLNVMSTRLGRIVDRARIIEVKKAEQQKSSEANNKIEKDYLWIRTRVINYAIGLCVTAGISICSLIVIIFTSYLWEFNLRVVVVTVFIGAMSLLILSLLCFVLEVGFSARSIRRRSYLR